MAQPSPRPSLADDDPNQSGGGSTGGGGDLVGYRLAELERRVSNLEQSVSDVRQTVATIKTQMETVATKYTVSFWIIGAVVVNFVALVGHLLIKSLGSG